jgi:hypothetical protein
MDLSTWQSEEAMSLNIRSYLEDLDREIYEYRQQICQLQVLIQQREDVRATMMQREEIRAAKNGQASPFGTLPNGGQIVFKERPALAAENIGLTALSAPAMPPQADDPAARRKQRLRLRERTPARRNYKREYAQRKAEEKRHIAAEYGAAGTEQQERQQRSDAGVPRQSHIGGPGSKGKGKKAHYLARVREIMADGVPRTGVEIIAILGVNKLERQSVYNALTYLKRQTGELHQTHIGEPYTLLRKKAAEPSDERFGDHVTGFEP